MITQMVREDTNEYKASPPDYDGLWKKIIEELFEEFMLFFAPDLYKEIDFSTEPDFQRKELYQKLIKGKKGRNDADQIIKVLMKNGEERWILIHIEVQDQVDDDFPKRMFRYFYRIYDHFDKEVYAIALLTNTKSSKQPNQFSYSFYGTKVDYTYNVYPFRGQNIGELEKSSNPFAAAVIAGIYASEYKKDVDNRYFFKRKLMVQLLQNETLQHEQSHTYLSALFYFIDYILQVPDYMTKKLSDELTPFLEKEAREKMHGERENPSPTLGELLDEFEEKGIAIGKNKATRKFAQELIRENFSDAYIAKLTKLKLEEVVELRRSMQP